MNNVHDLPAPQVIEVFTPEVVTRVGWLLDRDDFDITRSTLHAFAQVVDDHDFLLEDDHRILDITFI